MAAVQRGGSSQSVPGASTTQWATRLALVGIIGTVFFIVALTAMHFLRPHDIVLHGNTIGFYSVGPYGSICLAASIALGLCALALAFGTRRTVSSSPMTSRSFGSPYLRITGWRVTGGRYV
jgi:uncharacterized membrane protein